MMSTPLPAAHTQNLSAKNMNGARGTCVGMEGEGDSEKLLVTLEPQEGGASGATPKTVKVRLGERRKEEKRKRSSFGVQLHETIDLCYFFRKRDLLNSCYSQLLSFVCVAAQ